MNEKPRISAVLEILKPVNHSPTIMPWSNSLRSHFPPFWWLIWMLSEAPGYICMILCNALLADWIIACMIRCADVPNKVLSDCISVLYYIEKAEWECIVFNVPHFGQIWRQYCMCTCHLIILFTKSEIQEKTELLLSCRIVISLNVIKYSFNVVFKYKIRKYLII